MKTKILGIVTIVTIVLMMLVSSVNAADFTADKTEMKKGDIVADGKPEDIINEEIINNVYNVRCVINKEPVSNKLHIYPLEVSY